MNRLHSFALSLALALAGVLAVPPVAARGQETTPVPVVVTSASGRSVYIDKGSTSGIAVGMTVTLRPPRRSPIQATILSVSSTSARAELPPGEPVVVPGTPGEVLVPVDAVEPQMPPEEPPPAEGAAPPGEAPAEEERTIPEHPPWTYPDTPVREGEPLLAPVHRERPELRPTTVHGRVYASYDYIRDRGDDRDREYHTGRIGSWLEISNPFGKGGRIAFEGDVDYRRSEINSGFGREDDTTRGDLQRLSYAVGGQDYASYRLEFGRFFPVDLPEIGPMDGAEVTLQFEHGFRAGLGAGSYLRPFLSRSSGEDLGFHAFIDYQSTGEQHLSATVAFQKTWHEGAADRDLLLGRVNWRPVDTLWLFASWKVDLYTSNDDPKSSGPDLTELFASATWTPDPRFGMSATYNHYEWVAVERREFENIAETLIAEGEVDRAYASAWWRFMPGLRLSGRFGLWEDQVGDGTNGEVMLDVAPDGWIVNFDGGVYFSDTESVEGQGYRGRVTLPFDAGQLYVGYDQFDYDLPDFEGPDDDGTRQVIRGGLDFSLGRWSHSLYGDWDFGDDDDAYRVGFYSTYRF